MGALKVVRIGGARLAFAFEGAPEIGPYVAGYEARDAARLTGETLAKHDLTWPEP